jgi:hypothetical protein
VGVCRVEPVPYNGQTERQFISFCAMKMAFSSDSFIFGDGRGRRESLSYMELLYSSLAISPCRPALPHGSSNGHYIVLKIDSLNW